MQLELTPHTSPAASHRSYDTAQLQAPPAHHLSSSFYKCGGDLRRRRLPAKSERNCTLTAQGKRMQATGRRQSTLCWQDWHTWPCPFGYGHKEGRQLWSSLPQHGLGSTGARIDVPAKSVRSSLSRRCSRTEQLQG